MLTLATPALFVVAVVAAALVAVLHLLARQERRAEPLPTARFVPADVASHVVRLDRLRDRTLLGLRVAALLLLGFAAARPSWTHRSAALARVVLVDRSAVVANPGDAIDTVRALGQAAEMTIIAFDTTARGVTAEALGMAAADPNATRMNAGSLSAALVAGVREAHALLPRYRRVELHLISPVASSQVDAATLPIRSQWPESLFVHRLASSTTASSRRVAGVDVDDDDPVGAVARLALAHDPALGEPTVRIRRGPPTPEDSAWVRAAAGGRALMVWPHSSGGTSVGDTLAAVVTTSGAVVSYFARRALGSNGEPIAWWADGTPAAREGAIGGGCIREVGFSLPEAGDGALSVGTQRLMQRLAESCGASGDRAALPPDELKRLVAPPEASVRAHFDAPAPARSWLAIAALLGGLVLLLAEWYVRDRGRMGAEAAAAPVAPVVLPVSGNDR